jgi:hypothetical protein
MTLTDEKKHKGLSDEELAVRAYQVVKKLYRLIDSPRYQPTDKDIEAKIKGEG